MDFKIYAVGSNSTLVKEIEDALLLILEDKLKVNSFCGSEVKQYLDGSLYVCNQSQKNNLLPYIPSEKIVILNLTPTSQFYVNVSSIPTGSDVYVFNNKMAYIKTLINSCRELGINNVNYIPIPYGEVPLNDTIKLLNSAHYIIGVERLLDDVLLSGEYSEFLKEDVVVIGARRVASVSSACEIISRVNNFLYNSITNKLTEMVDVLCKTDSESLYNLYNNLDKIIAQISQISYGSGNKDKKEDAIIRSALNQIAPFNKKYTP